MLPCYPETRPAGKLPLSLLPASLQTGAPFTLHTSGGPCSRPLCLVPCLVSSTVTREPGKAWRQALFPSPTHLFILPGMEPTHTRPAHHSPRAQAARTVFFHTISCHAEGGRDLSSINITPLLSVIIFRAQFYLTRAGTFLLSHEPPAAH